MMAEAVGEYGGIISQVGISSVIFTCATHNNSGVETGTRRHIYRPTPAYSVESKSYVPYLWYSTNSQSVSIEMLQKDFVIFTTANLSLYMGI
jgi:hypothetical protein